MAVFAGLFPVGGQDPGDIDVVGTLQRLYYEVGAGAPFPRHIEALLNLVDVGRLMYGTDWPFGGIPGIEANTAALERRFRGRTLPQGLARHRARPVPAAGGLTAPGHRAHHPPRMMRNRSARDDPPLVQPERGDAACRSSSTVSWMSTSGTRSRTGRRSCSRRRPTARRTS